MRSFEHIASLINKTLIFAWYNLQSILDNHEITMQNITTQNPESIATAAVLITYAICGFFVAPAVGFFLMCCGCNRKCCDENREQRVNLLDNRNNLLDRRDQKAIPKQGSKEKEFIA